MAGEGVVDGSVEGARRVAMTYCVFACEGGMADVRWICRCGARRVEDAGKRWIGGWIIFIWGVWGGWEMGDGEISGALCGGEWFSR